MQIPVVRGVIERRLLINYRVEPAALARLLPSPFRPKLVEGHGIAGVCLIRLAHIRPWFVPASLGIASENAAHRIAVEWDQDGRLCEGVFIPRRDTSSRLNTWLGERLFPGRHHHARFQVDEQSNHFRVRFDSDDDGVHVDVDASVASLWSGDSVFRSLDEASAFFERGSLGYSVTRRPGLFDGLELRSFAWHVSPLTVNRIRSSYFDNRHDFAAGAAQVDCALLMRNIEHEWHSRPSMRCN